jgi:MATE family multidrug resistance protein
MLYQVGPSQPTSNFFHGSCVYHGWADPAGIATIITNGLAFRSRVPAAEEGWMTGIAPDVRPTTASCRELLRLAWPFILGQSFWTLQIILDRILLSRSSIQAVGAGMAAVMVFWAALTLFQYTANYATTFVAQYTGAGQPRRAGAVTGQALWFALGGGITFLGFVPLAGPLVELIGHASVLQRLEAIYFRCLCFSALPILVTSAASSFFAGRGDSRTVLLLNFVGLVVNGSVAWVLIFGHFGFEPMGIAGAGWATVAGTSASAVLSLALLLRPNYVREFGNGVGWAFDRELFGRLMWFGLPQGVGVALETTAFAMFLLFIGRLGEADLAATSIACTLNLLAFLPMLGVGQAIEVLVGQHLGADRPDEAERAAWTGLIFSASFTALVAAAYVFVPEVLALPFQTEGDTAGWAAVIERVPLLLRFVAVYCLFDSLNLVFSFALRGAGDTRFVTAAAVLLSWPLMVVPSAAAWYYRWGLYWAWGFASVYIILLAVTLLIRFLRGRWRQMRVIEQPSARIDERTIRVEQAFMYPDERFTAEKV